MRIQLPSGTPAELVTVDDAARGLVLIPDIGGLRPLFDDLCARLGAENSWTVCAPELWPGREQLTLEERLGSAASLDDADVLGDIAAAADATGAEKVGIIGFCMGGMYALKASGLGRFDRAVPFYGMIRIPTDWHSGGQGEPLDYVARPEACPVLAVVGTADPWTPAADVADLEAAGVEVASYQGCDHGFVHDPDRPTHNAKAAANAWQRAIGFLSV
jgi:carboxymethylenebutenolidase